jgi:hypothetical protein|tara:strand:- start:38 stop:490 length:453 start_codon:yes stop_codon:yes gene_type:complete
MANVNKTSYAVSCTPKAKMDAAAGVNLAMEVIHEDVRASLGGSGEITGDDNTVAGYADGSATTISSNGGTVPTHDGNTDLIFIKNNGTLVSDGSAASSTHTALVKHDSDVIATLAPDGAVVLPQPTGAVITVATGSGSNHVNLEVLVVGT